MVTAVILDLTSTMPTCKNGRSDSVEGIGLAFAVIKQAIVTRVKASRYGQTRTNLNSYPVPKPHSFLIKKSPEWNIPFW